ncbi:DUF192 domain-containing protein [Pseudohoeflea suaedae]|uniref:DUF192 domain-containing protein n=1 Tax=Pseudohoeflea suaedae TaxID=877384 RepID=A0A4R5PQ23_9HYPH|nr:DUF192 domain-containing protein [Pseudohoeflea suaedae]
MRTGAASATFKGFACKRLAWRAAIGGTAAFFLSFSIIATAVAVEFETSPEPLVIETGRGPVSFTVELATTSDERSQGLMNRESMAADHGMLFDFGQTRAVMMWMKNTIMALDMVFIGPDGKVTGVAADTVPFSEAIISSPGPVRYVLEINAGVAAEQGIAAGDTVVHPAVGPE